MTVHDRHYHVQSGDELLYGTYADRQTAQRVARRIRHALLLLQNVLLDGEDGLVVGG